MCCSGSPEDVSVAVGVGRTLENYIQKSVEQPYQNDSAETPDFGEVPLLVPLDLSQIDWTQRSAPWLLRLSCSRQSWAQGPPSIGIMENKMETTIMGYIGVI